MGKVAQWIKNLLMGKKGRERCGASCPRPNPKETRSGPLPMTGPRERRRRRSFRRSATGRGAEQKSATALTESHGAGKKKRIAAAAAVRDAIAVMRLTAVAAEAVEEDAAVKIQSVFRSYLARKALSALRGLVKLQALIRGRIVRRQATPALLSMKALATARTRARAQVIRMIDEAQAPAARYAQNDYRRSLHESRFHKSRELEENVKIVEMDNDETRRISKSRNNCLRLQNERRDLELEVSPARAEYFFGREESGYPYLSASSSIVDSTQSSDTASGEYPLFNPGYLANTESSRAKARPHSAPKQRADSCDGTPSQRRRSADGKNAARGVVSCYSGKLDRSSVSLQESSGRVSARTALTNARHCRALMAHDTAEVSCPST